MQHIDVSIQHEHNADLLGVRDIVIAAPQASGASLLGNIMLELGYDHHLDPYTEVVNTGGRAEVDPQYLPFRRRLAAMTKRDTELAIPLPARQE